MLMAARRRLVNPMSNANIETAYNVAGKDCDHRARISHHAKISKGGRLNLISCKDSGRCKCIDQDAVCQVMCGHSMLFRMLVHYLESFAACSAFSAAFWPVPPTAPSFSNCFPMLPSSQVSLVSSDQVMASLCRETEITNLWQMHLRLLGRISCLLHLGS